MCFPSIAPKYPVGTRRILDVYFVSNSRLVNTRIRKHVYYTSFLRLQNTRIFLDVLYTSNIRVDKCRLILVCIRRLKCVYFKLNLDVAFISKCLSFVFIYSSKNIFALFFVFITHIFPVFFIREIDRLYRPINCAFILQGVC